MTTPDQSAFDLEAGRDERDRAIEQVKAHADKDFIIAGRTAVEKCCFTLPRFTTDDVWAEIPEGVKTHEPRAMAVIMKYAEKNNWAYPLDQFRPSSRPKAHRGPKRVWRSILYPMRNVLQPSWEQQKVEPIDEIDQESKN